VAQGVFVATGRQYTTTTTIVAGPDGGCLLIDPAVSVAELAALAGWLASHDLRPVAGWSTHPHWDHLLWSRALGDVPRYATAVAAAAVQRERAALLAAVEDGSPGHDLALFAQVEPARVEPAQVEPARVEPAGGSAIDWPGPRAVIYAHDAHAPGHGAVFLPDRGVLVAGDMLSDIEVPLPDLDAPDPFGSYRAGLDLLAAVPEVAALVPGHGHVGGRGEFHRRIAADRAYLDAVAAGRDHPDDRLTEDWLRAEHARALALARAARRTETG
jgi:hydroxyacylglutathione hydrolase